jgi:multimeric flavodoxin WrbA
MEEIMEVLLINGSPHVKGCTYTALNEVAETLNHEGIDTEIFHIGTKPLVGCTACKK